MKRLLILTQKVDERDDLLGFFVAWIREFACHFDSVTVLTLGRGDVSLPSNVRVISLGKERGVSKIQQVFDLMRHLGREVRRHDAVFAHMSPIFAIAAAPFTKIFRKKLLLWYLHRSVTFKLRIALGLVDTLVTADAKSLNIHSSKIVAVGHGIDVQRFSFPERVAPENRPIRVLSVGRVSPIKGFETLIRAAGILGDNNSAFEFRIVGAPVMNGDHEYATKLRALIGELGAGEKVSMVGFVPYTDMPEQYRWADIVVGCTPPGGIDKTLLEGMAAGCVVVTSNSVMQRYLGADAEHSIFPVGDARGLSEILVSVRDFAVRSRQMVEYAKAFTVQGVIQKIVSCI